MLKCEVRFARAVRDKLTLAAQREAQVQIRGQWQSTSVGSNRQGARRPPDDIPTWWTLRSFRQSIGIEAHLIPKLLRRRQKKLRTQFVCTTMPSRRTLVASLVTFRFRSVSAVSGCMISTSRTTRECGFRSQRASRSLAPVTMARHGMSHVESENALGRSLNTARETTATRPCLPKSTATATPCASGVRYLLTVRQCYKCKGAWCWDCWGIQPRWDPGWGVVGKVSEETQTDRRALGLSAYHGIWHWEGCPDPQERRARDG